MSAATATPDDALEKGENISQDVQNEADDQASQGGERGNDYLTECDANIVENKTDWGDDGEEEQGDGMASARKQSYERFKLVGYCDDGA